VSRAFLFFAALMFFGAIVNALGAYQSWDLGDYPGLLVSGVWAVLCAAFAAKLTWRRCSSTGRLVVHADRGCETCAAVLQEVPGVRLCLTGEFLRGEARS
jgi:hypothetical protein